MTDPAADVSPAEAELLATARAAYVANPTPAPDGLVDTAMRTVVVDLRPARRLPLPDQPGFITDTAAANALRLVLDGDPAVVARRCRVEFDGAAWRVDLSVAVSYAHYDRHGDAAIRGRVIAAAAELFGAVVAAVDIHVVDVFTVHPATGAS